MTHQALFVLLVGVSVWSFAAGVRRRFRHPVQAVPRLPRDRPGARLWRAFLEVMLQTRVIRDRPVTGVLHALVMWGFLVFARVSVEHLSLGLRGLDAAEPDRGWYGAFAAAWAVAVLAGITGLAFRRFVLRPRWLGPWSGTSAAVAALIVALMVTYLLGWRGLEPGSASWKVNWWAHTLCFLGMLVVIPRSKHLHLAVAPLAVFFRSWTTSATRALRDGDEEDIGMVRFRDLSAKDLLDLHACVECGRCTEVCPANAAGGSLNPKEIVLQMQRGLLAGGDVIVGAWIQEKDLYQCLSCGACEEACPVGIEHVGAKILDLRRGLVSEGRTTIGKLNDLFHTMERAPHNPWGVPQETRRKLIESAGFPIFDGSQEWLFWLGCGLSYDPHGQEVARAMQRILNSARLSWGVLPQETCCGEPGRRAGNEYLFLQLSEKVIEALRQKKVRKIVACDPHCVRMLDVDYRQNPGYQGLGIEVVHHAELLQRLLPSLRLRPSAQDLTYHDPCYLARGRGVTREPRALLRAAGVSIREMKHHGKRTFCCGAGGAQLFLAEDAPGQGGRVNHRRFEEAAATGAAGIAVACPYCPIMLRDAASHAGRDDVAILDIAEIVAARL